MELSSAKRGKRTRAVRKLVTTLCLTPSDEVHVMEPDELLRAIVIPKPAPVRAPPYKYGEKEELN